jgi:lysozyme
MIDPTSYYTGSTSSDTAASNERAFLDMIAYAEGTAGPEGYSTMFGYHQFYSYADHPRQYFDFTDQAGNHLKSSAAGRYQIIVKTWDALKAKLGLMDFSPASQDAAAIELIRERGALADVQAGRIESAIRKCAPVWASLPGAGYNQPERQITSLLTNYQQAGGTFA